MDVYLEDYQISQLCMNDEVGVAEDVLSYRKYPYQ